jgi:hypothetical protein
MGKEGGSDNVKRVSRDETLKTDGERSLVW